MAHVIEIRRLLVQKSASHGVCKHVVTRAAYKPLLDLSNLDIASAVSVFGVITATLKKGSRISPIAYDSFVSAILGSALACEWQMDLNRRSRQYEGASIW